jgi:hypothetical protein
MTDPVVIDHPTTVRGPIESEHNRKRDDRVQKYREDRVQLESDYLKDIAAIQEEKSKALVGAGLNPDGSTPLEYGFSTDAEEEQVEESTEEKASGKPRKSSKKDVKAEAS